MSLESAVKRAEESVVRRLAEFFPAASPVRIPVRVRRLSAGRLDLENTIIEFGTPREIFFASALPLEFAERLRVQSPDASLDVEAQVVAVQYHEGRMAVVARFLGEVPNWILKA